MGVHSFVVIAVCWGVLVAGRRSKGRGSTSVSAGSSCDVETGVAAAVAGGSFGDTESRGGGTTPGGPCGGQTAAPCGVQACGAAAIM